MMTSDSTSIRPATGDDQPAVTELLAAAFLDGDLGPWLIPAPAVRARIYPPYFGLLVEQARDHGRIQVATRDDQVAAVAVWYPIAGGPAPAARDYPIRLAQITGPYVHRFHTLDAAMHHQHPYGQWHHYLALLAVHPDQQGRGLGSALLTRHHTDLDATGTPAYLEATSSRNARLYARHGYRLHRPFHVGGDGPQLLPMWRQPEP